MIDIHSRWQTAQEEKEVKLEFAFENLIINL